MPGQTILGILFISLLRNMGTKDCGKIHALFYSLIISAIINELNPRVYIHYLLTKIHELRRGTIDPITLLPDRIDCHALEQFAMGQIAFGQKMMQRPTGAMSS